MNKEMKKEQIVKAMALAGKEMEMKNNPEKTIWNPEQWTDKQRIATINLLWAWICTNDRIYELWKYLRESQDGVEYAIEYGDEVKEFQRMLHDEEGEYEVEQYEVEQYEEFYAKEKKEIEEYKLRKLAMKSPIVNGIH